MNMLKTLKTLGVNNLVYANELQHEGFLDEISAGGIECISALDTRAAVYLATGICAQNQKPVAVVVGSENSRSAFSGMTEAYYRRLPIILMTLGNALDYSIELRDVAASHHIVSVENVGWDDVLNGQYPMHIEIQDYQRNTEKNGYTILQEGLRSVLDRDVYLYVGQDVRLAAMKFQCKVVHGGLSNSSDGALSNVLGASLAGIRKRYIGLVSENEFLHDMNALGNINVNDSLLYFVMMKQSKPLIGHYASSLGFETAEIRLSELNERMLQAFVFNGKRTVVTLYEE